MIFLCFVFITGLFLVYTYFAGNVLYFINLDSIPIIILPGIIFSIFTFKLKEYIKGVKSMFIFNLKNIKKDNDVSSHFKSLILITIIVGILSTFQGLFSYILTNRDYKRGLIELPEYIIETTIGEAIVYASFSIVYALLISIFLLYPIFLIYKEKTNIDN